MECSNCKWYDESNGICLNRDSDYVTDLVDDDFVCEEWEEKQ